MIGYINNESGDLDVQNGDFVTGDIRYDVIVDTLNFMPGDDKFNPLFGCRLRTAMGGKPDILMQGKAKRQLKAQNIDAQISINNEEINISYE